MLNKFIKTKWKGRVTQVVNHKPFGIETAANKEENAKLGDSKQALVATIVCHKDDLYHFKTRLISLYKQFEQMF